jgi:hypothetical protein
MSSQSFLALDVFRLLWDIELLSAIEQSTEVRIPFDAQMKAFRDVHHRERQSLVTQIQEFCGFSEEIMLRERQDDPWGRIDKETCGIDINRLTAELLIAGSAQPGCKTIFENSNAMKTFSSEIIPPIVLRFLSAVLVGRFAFRKQNGIRHRDIYPLLSTLNQFLGDAGDLGAASFATGILHSWKKYELPSILSQDGGSEILAWIRTLLDECGLS